MHKAPIVEPKQIEHVINERKILEAAQHPCCVRLCGAYQDRNSLYLPQVLACAGERGPGPRSVRCDDSMQLSGIGALHACPMPHTCIPCFANTAVIIACLLCTPRGCLAVVVHPYPHTGRAAAVLSHSLPVCETPRSGYPAYGAKPSSCC